MGCVLCLLCEQCVVGVIVCLIDCVMCDVIGVGVTVGGCWTCVWLNVAIIGVMTGDMNMCCGVG